MNTSNPYASPYAVAAQPADIRATFIKKTYTHLAGAIVFFTLLETLFLQIAPMRALAEKMTSSNISWLIVMAIFMGASFMAQKMANNATSKGSQYAGLALLATAWAIVFLPIMLMATNFAPDVILQAAVITLAMVAGITFVAFTTKKDFSFLGGFLKIGGFVAIGLIVASMLFGFSLGIWFVAAMVIFAAVAVLKDTSDIIHHYGTEQYVAASVSLFASVALLFYYVLTLLLSLTGRD